MKFMECLSAAETAIERAIKRTPKNGGEDAVDIYVASLSERLRGLAADLQARQFKASQKKLKPGKFRETKIMLHQKVHDEPRRDPPKGIIERAIENLKAGLDISYNGPPPNQLGSPGTGTLDAAAEAKKEKQDAEKAHALWAQDLDRLGETQVAASVTRVVNSRPRHVREKARK